MKDAVGIPGKDWEIILSPSPKPCFEHRCRLRLLCQRLLYLGLVYFCFFWLFGEELSASELREGEESKALILECHHISEARDTLRERPQEGVSAHQAPTELDQGPRPGRGKQAGI